MSLDLEKHSPTEAEEGRESASGGFFQRVFAFFLSAGDPEKEKRRLLKQVAKDLRKSRYKFFSTRGDMAQPAMAKFFHEIYKVVGPAQTLLRSSESSMALRDIIIELHLDKELLALKESFGEAQLRERAEKIDTKTLGSEVKEGLVTFFSAFTADIIKNIDRVYHLFEIFYNFTMYDYYFFLKKFDSQLMEKDFSYIPRFDSISADYISEDIKDFLEVLLPIDRGEDWDKLFDVLKEYRNLEIVSRPAWKKILGLAVDIKNSGIMELIIRYTEKDPYYTPEMRVTKEMIVEPYLERVKIGAESAVRKILQERKNQRVERLAQMVFSDGVSPRMRNYTDQNGDLYIKRKTAGFTHTVPTNYLKNFMLDFAKKDMRELRDLLIIRGKWMTNFLSQQMSDSFQQVLNLSDRLIEFDESCGTDGDYGIKLRKVVNKADRDKAAMRSLQETIKEINGKAASLVSESGQSLVGFGKNIKNLIDDYDKAARAEIIINWKEVDSASEGEIKKRMTEVYRIVYYFLQLLQLYMKTGGN